MANLFFDHPILNSPYECPQRHWELDFEGQPTHQVLDRRRRAEFITPIPKPKKRKDRQQAEIVFDEGNGLSVLPPSSVAEMTLRLYGALNYSPNSARDLRCALNGA